MLFFTRFVFDLIVEQTNLYYMQVNAANPIFYNSWFSSIFSRDRFNQILRYLHCADNSKRSDHNAPGYKLFKVQALIDTLNLLFRNLKSLHSKTEFINRWIKGWN